MENYKPLLLDCNKNLYFLKDIFIVGTFQKIYLTLLTYHFVGFTDCWVKSCDLHFPSVYLVFIFNRIAHIVFTVEHLKLLTVSQAGNQSTKNM